MRYVAFEGGGKPVTALMSNPVQTISGDISAMVPWIKGNEIRMLAVFPGSRLPGALARILTVKE